MSALLRKDVRWLPLVPAVEAPRWGLDGLRGRLVEISARGAAATLTAAIELVLDAQIAGEPVGWMMLAGGTFYPPDVAASGVDLAALVVVRVADPTVAGRAAERLLRSGAFGLIVLDLVGGGAVELPVAHQGRLVSLAQTHDAAVVCLTDKPADAPSLGSLVSLRAEAVRQPAAPGTPGTPRTPSIQDKPGGFRVAIRALKDKRRGPGWSQTAMLRGPEGWLGLPDGEPGIGCEPAGDTATERG